MSSIHDIRIFNLAAIDILGTLIIVFIIHRYKFTKQPLCILLIAAIVISILAHIIFKVDTTLNYTLGLSNKPVRYRNDIKIFDIVSSKQ